MSKLKKIIIALISILLIFVLVKIVFAVNNLDTEDKPLLTPPSANGTINLSVEQIETTYSNVYCVAKNTTQHGGKFKLVAKAEIEGKKATFTDYTSNKTTTTNRDVNNIIAAFVASNTGGSIRKGFKIKTPGDDYLGYTEAQWGIWHYWNRFVDGALNQAKCSNNDTNTSGYESIQQAERERVVGLVTNMINKYNVSYRATIHYLTFVPDSSNDSSQNIIIVEPHDPGVEIKVNKEWDHKGNTIIPTVVNVDIKNGSTVIDTLQLNSSNGWSASKVVDLKNTSGTTIKYTVAERNIEGYTSEIKTNVDSNGNISHNATVTITNTLDPINIPVTKVWNDSNNADGIRPSSVQVKLLLDGSDTGKSLTLKGTGNKWTGTFSNVPNTTTYTIKEVSVEGYTTKITGNQTSEFTITNSHTPEMEIPVTKVWDDSDNFDKLRPTSITVKLLAGGKATGDTLTLDGTSSWAGKFTGLDPTKSYTIEEVSVEGYTTTITGNQTSGFTITNKHVPKIDIPVTKVWDDEDNKDGKRPTSVTVKLLAGGKATGDILTLNEKNNWTGTFSNLDSTKTYTIQENTVEGYTPTITGNQTSGFTITNTYEPERTTVSVNKVWNDDNNRDGKRSTSITVILKKDGVETNSKLTLNASNNWSGTFTGLDKYRDGGVEIQYSVKEITVSKYTTEISGSASTGYTITNMYIPERINIPVKKVWADDNDRDRRRPDSITVILYKNGVSEGSKLTLNSSNNWTGTFSDLYKYEGGKQITYTIGEIKVDNYTTSISGNSTSGFTITNTHIPEKINIPITKNWDDDSDRDGKRPTSITIILYGNGKEVKRQTITGNRTTNPWTYTFTDLYKYENGQLINYTIEEQGINDYNNQSNQPTITPSSIKGSVTIGVSSTSGFSITNIHVPERINVQVTKIWDDDNNRDGKRPESVTVKLFANGKDTKKTITLNEANGWKGSFDNLYKYEDAKEINYTVQEVAINSNLAYETPVITGDKTSGFKITNTHHPELIEIPVTKIWNDDNDRDGIRPSKIKVILSYTDTKVENGRIIEEKKEQSIEISGSENELEWTGKFTGLNKYKHYGELIEYTIREEEIDLNLRYMTPKIKPDSIKGDPDIRSTETTSGFAIENEHVPEKMKVTIIKKWDDIEMLEDVEDIYNLEDLDEYRPDKPIVVYLYTNDNTVINDKGDKEIRVELKPENDWKATVDGLFRFYNHGTPIKYEVREEAIDNYNETDDHPNNQTGNQVSTVSLPIISTIQEQDNKNSSGKLVKNSDITPGTKETIIEITNVHTPKYEGYIEIKGTVWEDLRDGKANDVNGIFDEDEKGLSGITVILRDKDGNYFDDEKTSVTQTKEDGSYTIKVNYDTTTNVYKLRNDPSTTKERLEDAYVEFVYDGMTYTTVATATTGADTSKAREDEAKRNQFDADHDTVVPEKTNDLNTQHPDKWTDKNIIAKTKGVISFETYADKTTTTMEEVLKYCYGDGTYIRTNPEGAWQNILPGTNDYLACTSGKGHDLTKYDIEVERIQNVNLGLFKREQPDVAIFSELSKVTVTMNSQEYTYLYNSRTEVTEEEAQKAWQQAYDEKYAKVIEDGMSAEKADEYAKIYAEQRKIQAKFENKDVYTYRRPVNPADIAYVERQGDENTMKIFVTYKVRVANTSSTLKVTVHNIINSYDLGYSITTEGWAKTATRDGFNEATSTRDLGIELGPLSEKELELTYRVNYKTIEDKLLKGEATLNNVVEIESFTTTYGENTLYAEQRTGGRTDKPYAGYDYDSHPGNAEIEFKTAEEIKLAYESAGKEYKEAGKDRLYSYQEVTPEGLEDDTDIAPSFTLVPDTSKTLSGNVWEDSDANTTDKERIGDGKKSDDENYLANAKVGLYKVDNEGNVSETPATLYKINDDGSISEKLAETYSSNNEDNKGYYSFGEGGYSVVTDRYVIRFTYGENVEGTTTSSEINGLKVNARNYKSTIISRENETLYNLFKDENKIDYEWHLKTSDGYSIAVDDMKTRVAMKDLQYNNFSEALDMIAESKPFEMQLEFYTDGKKESEVGTDGKTLFGNDLNIFDFGIIERPREDIFVEKTIDHVTVTLANGQKLIDGNPKDSLNYVKGIGFGKEISTGNDARNALAKRMVIEMDAELIQQAQLNIRYLITVTNNSEKDYDYYLGEETEAFDPSKLRTEYYYFGTNEEHSPEITNAINLLVDYIDTDYNFKWGEEYSSEWTEVSDVNSLDGLISEQTKEKIENNEYKAYTTTMFSKIERGAPQTVTAYASKLLANKDENKYENHIEILQIDAKAARTIGINEDEETVLKQYKPGDYIPSLNRKIETYESYEDFISYEEEGIHQQDDDFVEVVITPPTGLTENIIKYSVIALTTMIVISLGIIFIKKKVLTK